ncbi:MAG: capsule assembly Wzi family protein [Candidatus Rokuibacteriota bacterium]
MFGRSPARSSLAAVFLIGAALVPIADAVAFDRTNLPLKNWGGFSEYRDAAYDDLERLVTAGLADRTLLNTKPLSRVEAARIVARAIQRIRRDEPEGLNLRRDLEPVLDRLMEEFRVELAALGVQVPDGVSPPGTFSFTPIDRAQVFGGWASHGRSLVNEQGSSFHRGFNNGFTFESRMQIGDFLTFYVQPEVLINEDFAAIWLITGYAKLTLWNVELLVGRDNLQWGPGYRNSLLFSPNAAPLDQVRLGSAEPFYLPWIGQWVGPMKALIFLAQLEERRDHPDAKLSGMRVTFSPATWLELGASRAVMFNGGPSPYLPASKYPEAIFNPQFGDDVAEHPENRTNNLFSVDGDFRFRNLDRYYFPSRDLRLYGEFYWDDTCGECGPSSGIGHFLASNFLPKGIMVGAAGGIHFLGLFGQDWLDARFEYARTSPQSYNHDQFISGYWTRGHVIGSSIGTNGRDYFARVSARLAPNLMLGVNFDRAIIGSTTFNFTSPQEKRLGGGIDVSYRFRDRYSLFAQYLVSDVKSRNFRSGDDGIDQLLRVELTRSFR